MSTVLISVIVPAYNAAANIDDVIHAIRSQDTKHSYEVIIIDDGSTDTTASIIRKFPDVIYHYQANAGPASARNHGARLAKGEYLAFTDSDCRVHRDWLNQLISGFTTSTIGVVAGSYGITNTSSQLARCIHKEIIYRHTHLMPLYPKAFGGYNFCARKEVFWQVGGFDENYRNASGEDNDLSYKIINGGYVIYFNRQALVDHVHPTEVGRYLNEQARHGFWRVAMYATHPKMMRGDDYTFWKDVVEIPWALLCVGTIVLSCLSGLGFGQTIMVVVLPFLIFEIVSACFMMCAMFDGLFFGFVTFFRSFARAFGFSSGFLQLFYKKIEKKFK